MTEKQCSRCKVVKPITDFSKRSDRDAYRSQCRACENAAYQARYRANPERARELGRAREQRYQERHPERRDQISQRYYANHRAEINERATNWRHQYPESNRASARQWKANNPAENKAAKHARRAREKGASGSFTPAEWRALTERYEYRCLRCGKQAPEITLTADHVVPLTLGGTNDISNIQPLCFSCNSSKQATIADYR